MGGEDARLYLVWVDGMTSKPGADFASGPAVMALADGLFLVRSEQTRSALYHSIKRRTDPGRLLVAPLAGEPKFKGMAGGALKWLRGAA